MQMLLRPQKINIVRRHQRHAEFASDPFRLAQYPPVARRQMLHLDPQPPAKNIFQPRRTGTARRAPLVRRVPTVICVAHSRGQGAQRDYTFGMLRQLLERHRPFFVLYGSLVILGGAFALRQFGSPKCRSVVNWHKLLYPSISAASRTIG